MAGVMGTSGATIHPAIDQSKLWLKSAVAKDGKEK